MSIPRPHWWLDDSDTPAPTPVTQRPHLTDATARLIALLSDGDLNSELRANVHIEALTATTGGAK